MFASQQIFVTGANGRVGQRLVTALVAQGARVVGLARSEAKARAVRSLGAQCVVGDLGDREALEKGVQGAGVLFHLAGGLRGAGSVTADQVNHQGTRTLIDVLSGVRAQSIKSVVFTSSAAVYGDRSGLWVDESMPVLPQTLYGLSKVEAENALLSSELPIRVARLSAVYGEGFPFMMVDQIRKGTAWLPGEGGNHVSTIHIDDAVAGLLRIAEAGKNGETYNLSDRSPLMLRDFYRLVFEHVGGKPLRFWSTWVPSRVQFVMARSNERIMSRMGRAPKVTPDALKLFLASSRLNVDKLLKELDFSWRYPSAVEGLTATLQSET